MKNAKKLLSVLLTLTLIVSVGIPVGIFTAPTANAATSVWDGTVSTSFSGSGTAASPYIIDTAAKLAGVAQQTNNNTGWSNNKYFVLTADINLNNREWTPIGIQRQNGGSTTYAENKAWFCGYFDGNGHTVSNVRVGSSASSRSSVKHVGLFGIIGGSAQILNLGVETATYYINHYCDDERVGGFVGYCKGVIQGCYVRNVIINQSGVCVIGGFCGQATSESTIYKCYAYNVSLTQGSGRKAGFVGDGDGTVAFSFVNYYPFKSSNSGGSFIYAYGETNATGDIVGNGTNTGYGPESFMSSGSNGGWPQLIWQQTGPLEYNTTDGYIVDSAAKMRTLACFVNNGRSYSGAKIALKADLDLSSYDWAPVGIWQTNRTRAFSGTFNGNGYIISNVKIGTSSSRNTIYLNKGLFGYTSNAVINCVGINNAQIYGNGPTDYRCGALVGKADGGSGRIYQCFVKNSTVNMSGTGVSGVIVGDLRHNITDCYSLASSATGTRAGSVVGDKYSTIYNVYSGANCSSTSGNYLAQSAGGSAANCYDRANTSTSAGYVNTFNSYANRTDYWKSSGAWITDVYNINGGYACLKWEPRFSIAFNAGGGSVSVSPLTGRYQYTATTPTALRDYYNFNGYYTASSGGTRVIGQSETYTFGTTNPSNSSQTGTLYAQWSPWQHTVAYDANGGSGAPASQTKTFGTQMNLSSTVPTKTGYHFTGWNTKQDGSGTTWAAGANYTPDQNGGTVTLWAQWEINSYAVTFNKNGTGYTNTTPASTVTHGGSVSFTVTLSTGYTNSANPSVTATNGTVSASKSGNTITYTVSNITAATSISVGAATINSYGVTFNKNGTGYTNTTPASTVTHGGSVSFTVTLS
ncbi:MAG: InlB B-repeat-containing protein, partial [Clostridia bacterium]|nr:InlB B-repeat-containing protein [Clostridia bacterium]